jgi:hypothetical protein
MSHFVAVWWGWEDSNWQPNDYHPASLNVSGILQEALYRGEFSFKSRSIKPEVRPRPPLDLPLPNASLPLASHDDEIVREMLVASLVRAPLAS